MKKLLNDQVGHRTNVARAALEQRASVDQAILAASVYPEPVVVQSYDFEAQTVNVAFKDKPHVLAYPGVRIWGPGGLLRIYRPFEAGDVGLLLWMLGQGDSQTFGSNEALTDPKVSLKVFPVFVPGWPVLTDGRPAMFDPAGDSNLNEIGPSDAAIVARAGTADETSIVFKATGEIIHRANRHYFVKNGDDVADAEFLELDGVGVSTSVKVT